MMLMQKNVEIVVPFKYLGNYWRTLEMQLKNREINLILTWAANYVLANSIGVATFAITYTKLYVQVVPLLTEDNAKLQLK